MDRVAANPLLVALFFIVRCMIPLIIMLGVSAVLKKLGLITGAPKPPPTPKNNPIEQGELANENH